MGGGIAPRDIAVVANDRQRRRLTAFRPTALALIEGIAANAPGIGKGMALVRLE
jgi:hypothetical protein